MSGVCRLCSYVSSVPSLDFLPISGHNTQEAAPKIVTFSSFQEEQQDGEEG